MTLKLQLIIGIFLLVMLIFIVNMVRRKKIDLRYALSWMIFIMVLIILDVFPQIIYCFAEIVGIEVPSNMVFSLGFILIVILLYSLTISVSKLSMKVKRLTQEIALLKKQLEEMKDDGIEK